MRPLRWGVAARPRPIRLLAMDCDGVLTDGGLWFSDSGEVAKRFCVYDGVGVKLLQAAGIELAIITGHPSLAVDHRARQLGILAVLHAADKVLAMEGLLEQHGLAFAEVAYIGDDLIDIPLLGRVGLPIAVASARREVKRVARYVTRAPGGHGAVREVAEWLLTRKGEMT